MPHSCRDSDMTATFMSLAEVPGSGRARIGSITSIRCHEGGVSWREPRGRGLGERATRAGSRGESHEGGVSRREPRGGGLKEGARDGDRQDGESPVQRVLDRALAMRERLGGSGGYGEEAGAGAL